MNRPLLHTLTTTLRRLGQSVTCAESCTGGLLAAELTRLPGSSVWFESSFVTYSNAAKQQLLGVRATTLAQHGAVSVQTVAEMAAGARAVAAADYALAISGIAGPDGGNADKPVGTVCFALATAHGILTDKQLFSGTRDDVRAQAVHHALALLANHLHPSGK